MCARTAAAAIVCRTAVTSVQTVRADTVCPMEAISARTDGEVIVCRTEAMCVRMARAVIACLTAVTFVRTAAVDTVCPTGVIFVRMGTAAIGLLTRILSFCAVTYALPGSVPP